MDLGLNSGERPPLSVSLSGHRGAGGRYNIKTREFIFCARRVVDTLRRKYEKIIPFSIYIYSGPPYLLLSVRGQSARKSQTQSRTHRAGPPRARRGPAAACNVPSRATANWSVRAAPPAPAARRQMLALLPHHATYALAGRCCRQRPPYVWGRSGGGRQRLLEGDTAGVADVVAPDVQLLEHRRPRGLERRGERHSPLPRKGAA